MKLKLGEQMIFRQIKSTISDNFSYIIADERSREAAVIDPSWDTDTILETVRSLRLDVKLIINTHTHPDHTTGNRIIASKTGAKIVMHVLANMAKDVAVRDGDTIRIGELELKVIHTPGHTPDHICLLVGNKLLTGDVLFVGGCGRTDLPGGDPEQMYESLFRKISSLPDNIEVYPGHDYGDRPSSTISEEKKTNYALKPRSKEEFLRFISEG
jgi:hydroxyacylglutathione hydrolase